ncbi:uncharacterized protein LOC114255734 [Monomorium pharaonis]|uniref:uncharacterized protein LOC114255734 n=1 Tax=Monomorium pharaonis TaxID=307658 RepID=UPI00102E1EA7|nr:uncharacterized protein LOC114255734 [Monomorium pharaonis]
MVADCEIASNYSSVSSERARMYCGGMYQRFSERPYDSLRLENVRVSMTAERKKPVLITRSRTLVNGRSQVESNAKISREMKAFGKSRYEARRKFFEDLECQKNSATDLVMLSETKATCINDRKNKSMFEQISTIYPNKEKLRVKLYDTSLIKANRKEHVENLDSDTQSSNNIAVHSVAWTNIAQPSFVERVNMKKANSRNIVSYINGTIQTEEEKGHYERAECPTVEMITSIKTSSTTCEDKSDSTVGMDNEQQRDTTNTEMTLARNCAKTFQYDNNDNEENLQLSDLSSNNYDGRSSDHYEYDDDKEALADKEMNNELKSSVELKKENVRSWIETICDSNWSNISETDKAYESYCNDITKIVESIDVNIASSKTELDALPDTDACVKYNLDSANMSLIYSLTPPAAVDQDESGNDDTSQDIAERSSEWQSDLTRSDNDEPLSDYIWIEPEATKTECVKSTRDHRSSSGSSCGELDQPVSERDSGSGSDILELPSYTFRELKDIDGEIFLNGINESANEIIADLNASVEAPSSYEAVEVAQQIITEIIESIYILLHLDSSIYDLSVLREIVCNLINNYHRECLLIESGDQAYISNVDATSDNNIDNICRIKGFLGNLSSNCDDYNKRDYEIELHKTENHESPAVIEFCTVAKKLPIVAVDNNALELNFRIIKVSTNEYTDVPPGARLRLFGENSIVVDRGLKIDKSRDSESAAVIKSEIKTWPCERCFYCEEEESIREKLNLTPISEEPDDVSHEAIDTALKDLDDESLCHLKTGDVIEENTAANPMKKHISLDDTYTISEVSSVIISDNDDVDNDFEGECVLEDIGDSSIDCMSCSYETKEFMYLEKALAAETTRD